MQLRGKLLGAIISVILLGPACFGATVSGTVKGPDGAPFQGAFVEAQDAKTRITYIGLSDGQGHYRVESLPASEYRIQTRALGYQADPRTGVNLTANQNSSIDIALRNGTVRWNDLSVDQYKKLWPDSRGKELLFQRCIICHNWQTRIASVERDEDGWRDRVEYMRRAMFFSLGKGFTDQDASDVAGYLAKLFGPNSVLPKSPTDMAAYKDTVPKYSNEAMNIHYVEYDMPGPNRMPFSATPAKDGTVWIPDFGDANKITRLDPKTGKMDDYDIPTTDTAAAHSVWPADDGTVWIAEQGTNQLGKWDPATKEITQYQDVRLPNDRPESGGQKHTTRVDPGGYVWTTGVPLSRFDPKTREFTDYHQIPLSYGIEPADKNGDIWFTEASTGRIAKVEWKTQKITEYTPPTKDFERRLAGC